MNRSRLVRQQRHQHGLGFDPQDAVRWLAPKELARAGLKAVLAAVFADYADKREIQGSLDQGLLEVPGAPPDSTTTCWFDYTSDLGDGFDATYTVASLLAEESLTPAGTDTPLPRGSLLVLGGDEVYPTASAQAYEDRMTGPYRAALPHAAPSAGGPPVLLALPGNHDWYDGLTSFLRVFTHGRSIGGWSTVQRRSYFAVQLPHRWWLVALDSQFESYIDEPQLRYFEEHLSAHLQPGDGVILCSASPTWLKTGHDPDAFNPLFWFEKHYIRARRVDGTDRREPTGAEVRLWLTGDLHHYARYVEQLDSGAALPPGAARQMVTCGLGGAFLSATHHLEESYRILPKLSRSYREGDEFSDFLREATLYPSEEDSRALARGLAKPWRSTWLLWRNPGLLPLLAGAHTLLFLLLFLLFGQGDTPDTEEHGRVVQSFVEASAGATWAFAAKISAACLVGALLLWVLPMARLRPPFVRLSILAAVLSQVGVVVGVFLAVHGLVALLDVDGWPDILLIAGVSALAAALGGLTGGLVLGIAIVCFQQGAPLTWQMSGQAIEDHKGFLRIRIDPDGVLTLHPLVVDEVNRDWAIRPFHTPTDSTTGEVGPPIQVPRASTGLPTPRLIEEPFAIARTSGRRPS